MDVDAPDHPVLIFDGDCGFCRRSVGWLHRRVPGSFEAVPYQTSSRVESRPELSREACREEVKLLLEDGRILGGAEVFFHLLGRRPLLRPLRWLYRLPLLHGAADAVYRWIARRRRCLVGSSDDG